MPPNLSYADVESQEKILASVTKVVHPENTANETVTLWMTIHSPSRFGGFQFIVVTDSTDRTKIRAEFPTGSLQTLELPANIVKKLEEQIDAHLSIEKTLDSGINPMRISQAFLMPSVKISELPSRPIGFRINIKQIEQGNGGNS